MTITRVITDVSTDRVGFAVAIIEFDGGVIVERRPEPDGEVTLVVDFPGVAPQPLQAAADTPQSRWLAIAQAEIGQAEFNGGGDNPRIEVYHGTTKGGAAPDSVPWCSSFVNFCVRNAGLEGTDSKMARSWMDWGSDAAGFTPGCVVILKRGAPPLGHVGFFVGTEGGRIRLLGGNQSNRVGIASFDADKVIARRTTA